MMRFLIALTLLAWATLTTTLTAQTRQLPLTAEEFSKPLALPSFRDTPTNRELAETLQRNLKKWRDSKIESYQFVLFSGSIWGTEKGLVCVERGIASYVGESERSGNATVGQPNPSTIPQIFELLERALDAEELRFKFDAHRGFPTYAGVDRSKSMIDEEWALEISGFREGPCSRQ